MVSKVNNQVKGKVIEKNYFSSIKYYSYSNSSPNNKLLNKVLITKKFNNKTTIRMVKYKLNQQ
jgi:hypothetical protein